MLAAAVTTQQQLVHKATSKYATLRTTRALAAGEQMLVAYGRGFTSQLRKAVKEQAARAAAGP